MENEHLFEQINSRTERSWPDLIELPAIGPSTERINYGSSNWLGWRNVCPPERTLGRTEKMDLTRKVLYLLIGSTQEVQTFGRLGQQTAVKMNRSGRTGWTFQQPRDHQWLPGSLIWSSCQRSICPSSCWVCFRQHKRKGLEVPSMVGCVHTCGRFDIYLTFLAVNAFEAEYRPIDDLYARLRW